MKVGEIKIHNIRVELRSDGKIYGYSLHQKELFYSNNGWSTLGDMFADIAKQLRTILK